MTSYTIYYATPVGSSGREIIEAESLSHAIALFTMDPIHQQRGRITSIIETATLTPNADLIEGGAALSGAFIAVGAEKHARYDAAVEILGEGMVEFTDQLMRCGVLTEMVWNDTFAGNPPDAVWEYEVAEPLGRWIVEYVCERQHFPPPEKVLVHVREMTHPFTDEGPAAAPAEPAPERSYPDGHARYRVVDEDDTVLESYSKQEDAELRMSTLDDTYLMDGENVFATA